MLRHNRRKKHSSPEAISTVSPTRKKVKITQDETIARECGPYTGSYSSFQTPKVTKINKGKLIASEELVETFEMRNFFTASKDFSTSHHHKSLFSSPQKQLQQQKQWLLSPVGFNENINSRRASLGLLNSDDFVAFQPSSHSNDKECSDSLRNNYTLLEKSPSIFSKRRSTDELFQNLDRHNKGKMGKLSMTYSSSPIKQVEPLVDHVVRIDEAFLTSEMDIDTNTVQENYPQEIDVKTKSKITRLEAFSQTIETNPLDNPFSFDNGIVDEHSGSSQPSTGVKLELLDNFSTSSRKEKSRNTTTSRSLEIRRERRAITEVRIKSEDSIFQSWEEPHILQELSQNSQENNSIRSKSQSLLSSSLSYKSIKQEREETPRYNSNPRQSGPESTKLSENKRDPWPRRSSFEAQFSESSFIRGEPHDSDTLPVSNSTLATSTRSTRSTTSKERTRITKTRTTHNAKPSRAPSTRNNLNAFSTRVADGPSANNSVELKRTEKKKKLCLRSRNGCWTCRIRHKGCPEERPHCSTCVRLGLTCDYSQERPLYMVDSTLEYRKLKEIREATNKTKKGFRPKRDDIAGYEN